MSFFKRAANIIKSNINHKNEIDDIDIDSYENTYYDETEPVSSISSEETEYYKTLEVEIGADFKKIKSAYKRLLKKYHPDLYQNNKEKQEIAIQLTKKINEAYTYFERKYL